METGSQSQMLLWKLQMLRGTAYAIDVLEYQEACECGRDAKKPGEPGRYIQDDPRKYPNKENLGPFGQCSRQV